MPVLPVATASRHDLPHARFHSLATPRRGTRENCVWRVALAPGAAGVPHRLTREEIFVVLSGTVEASFDGERQRAGAGDAIVVPAQVEFSLSALGAEPAELVCCMPVGGKAQLAEGQAFTPPWAE